MGGHSPASKDNKKGPSHNCYFNFWHGPVNDTLSTQLKECLKFSEVAKFESDALKTNNSMALQSHRIVRMF